MGWSLQQIMEATGGSILRSGTWGRFGEIVTDSTRVEPGAVFVALKGAHHDAHRFIPDALMRAP